jgi:hypothetical protein
MVLFNGEVSSPQGKKTASFSRLLVLPVVTLSSPGRAWRACRTVGRGLGALWLCALIVLCHQLVLSLSLVMVSLLAFPVWKRQEWEEGVACLASRNGTSLGLNPSLLLQGGLLLPFPCVETLSLVNRLYQASHKPLKWSRA